MRFDENNVLGQKYINILYMNFGVLWRGMYMVHLSFFFYYSKKWKVQEYDLYLNQILHHFDFKKKSGQIIKNL